MENKNVRELITAFVLFQFALVLFALVIQYLIEWLTEMMALSKFQEIMLVLAVFFTSLAFLYFTYRKLLAILSMAGISEQVLPKSDVMLFRELMRKLENQEHLSHSEKQELERLTSNSYLPKNFVSFYVENHDPFTRQRRLMLYYCLIAIYISQRYNDLKPKL